MPYFMAIISLLAFAVSAFCLFLAVADNVWTMWLWGTATLFFGISTAIWWKEPKR